MSLLFFARPTPPASPPTAVGILAVVAIVFYVGYKIYSAVLKQMAINAKNKRIIKNEVTQWTGREYRIGPKQTGIAIS